MRKFLFRILMLITPMIIIITIYVILDPFKAVWHYEHYYSSTDLAGMNRGYISTCIYDNNYKTHHYDSFIFGNSRSLSYMVDEWKKYIPQSSSCFHFDCSTGCIEDLYYKVKYINEHGDTLRNALFVIDRDVLSHTSLSGHLFAISPQIKEYENYGSFQLYHLQAFVNPVFLCAFLDYTINHEYRKYMGYYIPEYRNKVDPITNEVDRVKEDSLIRVGKYYTSEYVKIYENVQFPDSISPVALNNERKDILTAISKILMTNKTNFRIIINPLYNQIKLNPSDLAFLKKTFGAKNVYDFSGRNKWNKDYHNYYETSHYRPCVANEVLKIIYESTPKSPNLSK